MTIGVSDYGKIRDLWNKGFSIRKIAKKCHVSRGTVDKYCEGGVLLDEDVQKEKSENELKKLVQPEIIKYLDEYGEIHGKQKLKSKHVWKHLKSKGFTIGESTVRKYLSELKNKKPNVFIPLGFEPAEFMQIDWGDNYAFIDGKKTMISTLCVVLPYSYAPYAVPLPTKAYESLFWGLCKSFEYYGGVSQKCVFDNMKTAVLKNSGKNAVMQKTFEYFVAHYNFEPVFCNAASGWEKGGVEDLVAITRQIAFTPIPRVKTLEELTVHVHEKCVEYLNEHKLRSRKLTVKEAFALEKEALLPLPLKAFDTSKTLQLPIYKDATFTFDKNKYSIFPEYIGEIVSVKADPFNLRVYYQGKLLFTHKRTYIDNDPQYIPEHYLKYIERKPRCIENALPLKIGIMPDELKTFRELCKSKEKYMELINVLKLGETTDREILLRAVDLANKSGAPTYKGVLFYLSLQADSDNTAENTVNTDTEYIISNNIEINSDNLEIDLSIYDSLCFPYYENEDDSDCNIVEINNLKGR